MLRDFRCTSGHLHKQSRRLPGYIELAGIEIVLSSVHSLARFDAIIQTPVIQ